MEELSNRQIVLLTMLVSFVVSTATGIMTVAMLEEAPQTLTQTVNRVVERTIERVVTGTSSPERPMTPVLTVTKEVTIYAKEDDLIIGAVEKNQPRIAKIYGLGTATTSRPSAIGFVISRDGIVATDASTLSALISEKKNYVVMIGEKEYVGTLLEKDDFADSPVSFIRLMLLDGAAVDAVSYGSDVDKPKIAQSAIVLGGESGTGILKATLAKFVYAKAIGTSSPVMKGIETSSRIPLGYEGSLVVNLDGQAIGIVIAGTEAAPITIYPASRILNLISVVTKNAGAQVSPSTARVGAPTR